MVKIIVPIAGNSVVDTETQYIKSLIEIERRTILQHVVESLSTIDNAEFIFVIRKEDVTKYHLDNVVKLMAPSAKIVVAESNTAGSACTCLLAIGELDEDGPVIISGSDQLIEYNLQSIIDHLSQYDAGTVIFEDVHPRWSFVKLDENNCVIEAAEKNPISKNATTGLFYFKKAKHFVNAVEDMIRKDAAVNGAYYVCPALNELVLKNMKIGTFRIPKECYFNFNNKTGIQMYEGHLKKRRF